MGQPGVLHGVRTYILQSPTGQIIETHSISAGLDYPGVGPEHAWLKDSGRAEYVVATDEQALRGFRMLTQREGIIPGEYDRHYFHDGIVHQCFTTGDSLGIFACDLGGCPSREDLSKRYGHRCGEQPQVPEILQEFADTVTVFVWAR